METIQGFAPFIDNQSEILVLGSFPSVKSRQAGFYYGNRQNRFWKVLATTFEESLPLTTKEKQEICRKHKIAMWDVVIESDLKGSSDEVLKNSILKIADLISLLNQYPNIKKILCNGLLAYNLFQKYYGDKFKAVKMPSTSPANVRFDIGVWINEIKN